MRSGFIIGALTAVLVAPAALALAGAPATPKSAIVSPTAAAHFESKIRPLLLERCINCHGEKLQQAGLRLDSAAALRKGSKSGSVILAGDPLKSPLLKAVRHEDGMRMPPGDKLSDPEIAALTAWVKAGAPWPAAVPVAAQNRPHWAFQPVRPPQVPAVKNRGWVKNPLDAFILARLESKGVAPSAAADRRTLLRRATFDLTGLPPTPEEVARFEQECDDELRAVARSSNQPARPTSELQRTAVPSTRVAPRAYARLIDRLLDSPAYGERWGRHWLDLARYADSKDVRDIGQPFDIVESYRYRDWVVKALNRDLPYDQFIRQQIAGDLLPPSEPGGVNADGIIATTFLTIGCWGPGDADVQKMYADMVDDQVNVVSRAFLSLTVGCARCHDHKFDPISAADYYGLAGIFFSTQIAVPQISAPYNKVPLITQEEIERRERYLARIPQLQNELKSYVEARYAELPRAYVGDTARYLMAAWDLTHAAPGKSVTPAVLAQSSGLREDALKQWLEYLSPGSTPTGLMSTLLVNANGPGIHAWRGAATEPVLVVNTTDKMARVPGTMPPHSVAIHPGPTTGVAVSWQAPNAATVRVHGRIAHAHPDCGDSIEWVIERLRAGSAERLAGASLGIGGASLLTAPEFVSALQSVTVAPGDQLRLVVLPKQNHGCDLTLADLHIDEMSGEKRSWSLARDLVAGPFRPGMDNPHADSYGNAGTWSFLDMAQVQDAVHADRSASGLLAPWFNAASRTDAERAAAALQQALSAPGLMEQAGPLGKLLREIVSGKGPFRVTQRDDARLLPPDALAKKRRREAEIAAYVAKSPGPVPYAMGAREGGVPGTKYAGFTDARIHIRGRYDRLGDVIPRRFPIVLAGEKQPPITKGSGRLELANWIAGPENPLTARVLVNRVWQHHFGEGLVRTPGNFGKLGEKPTHPELLDWLAAVFVATGQRDNGAAGVQPKAAPLGSLSPSPGDPPGLGWSIKKLHRLIMLSSTYQQSSSLRPELRADPENRLWARANVRRLDAEAIRDTLLAVSGSLDRTLGGPPLRKPGEDALSRRRAIYLMTNRSDKTGFRFLYDAADPENIVDQRNVSTVAPQSLFLLNDPLMLEQTRVLADRLLKPQGQTTEQRIAHAYQLLYGRAPTVDEVLLGYGYLKSQQGAGAAEAAAWQEYCQVLLCANELIYVD